MGLRRKRSKSVRQASLASCELFSAASTSNADVCSALIAVLAYFLGGYFYQRNVMHQRGWRQLPNYSFWAGIGGFFRVSLHLPTFTDPGQLADRMLQDTFIILTSSCANLLPGRRGYSRVSLNGDNSRGRGRQAEDENRLIDQLDEEWDD